METPFWAQVKFVLHLTRFTNASNLEDWSMIYTMLILLPQTSNLHIRKLCCVFEDNEAVIKMIIKGRSPTTRHETCFQNPQSCSWLVVRSNQFGPQNPNQIHWHQKPTGATYFGRFRLWPGLSSTLANFYFGQSYFGQFKMFSSTLASSTLANFGPTRK